MLTPALRITGLCTLMLLGAASMGDAWAQTGIGQSSGTGGNPVLRDPGAFTPQPRRAGPPPQTWSPGPVQTPAARSLDPNPNCISNNCPNPPIIRRP